MQEYIICKGPPAHLPDIISSHLDLPLLLISNDITLVSLCTFLPLILIFSRNKLTFKVSYVTQAQKCLPITTWTSLLQSWKCFHSIEFSFENAHESEMVVPGSRRRSTTAVPADFHDKEFKWDQICDAFWKIQEILRIFHQKSWFSGAITSENKVCCHVRI